MKTKKRQRKNLDQLIQGLNNLRDAGYVLETLSIDNEIREAMPGDPEWEDYPVWKQYVQTGRKEIHLTIFNPGK